MWEEAHYKLIYMILTSTQHMVTNFKIHNLQITQWLLIEFLHVIEGYKQYKIKYDNSSSLSPVRAVLHKELSMYTLEYK